MGSMVSTRGPITLPHASFLFRGPTVPTAAQAPYAPQSVPQSGGGTLDLNALVTYFTSPGRGTYSHQTLQQIRAHFAADQLWVPPALENIVEALFVEYCTYLRQNVDYVYSVNRAPFQTGYAGTGTNCLGRANGLLQLLTVIGLPAARLWNYTLGGANGIKICEVAATRRSGAVTSYAAQVGTVARPAPNAIQVRHVNGELQVDRTPREPFSSHDAALIEDPLFNRKCWDPLLMMSYNDFSDCFRAYRDVSGDASLFTNERWAELQRRGLQCYISEEFGRGGDRIYYLPPRSTLLNALAFPHLKRDVRTQASLIATYNEMAALESDPCLAVIFDQEDWEHQKHTHPPALLDMFRFRPL